MKSILLGFVILSVVGLAAWAYSENYTTKQTLDDVIALNQDIGQAKSRLRVLNAEWAYLNRPERLTELTKLNFDALQLLHLTPDHFADLNSVTGENAVALPITTPIEVMNREDQS